MDPFARRKAIMQIAEEEGFVRMRDLVAHFQVSPETIHRDLDLLTQQSRLERVRGGAQLIAPLNHEILTDWELRRHQAPEAKAAIALRARQEIADGAVVFLDASTTALALAERLAQDPPWGLTMVTNSPAIAFMMRAEKIHVIVTPGELNQSLKAITGGWTIEFLEPMSFTVAFVSAASVTREHGLMTTQRVLAEVTRAALGRAARRIALIDSTKFDTFALIGMASAGEIDMVITDDALPSATERNYTAANFTIVRAPVNERGLRKETPTAISHIAHADRELAGAGGLPDSPPAVSKGGIAK